MAKRARLKIWCEIASWVQIPSPLPTHKGERKMLEELERLVKEDSRNNYKFMKDILPIRAHRTWKKSYLNKCVVSVIRDIKSYRRRNGQ